jgi:hypothetical protein
VLIVGVVLNGPTSPTGLAQTRLPRASAAANVTQYALASAANLPGALGGFEATLHSAPGAPGVLSAYGPHLEAEIRYPALAGYLARHSSATTRGAGALYPRGGTIAWGASLVFLGLIFLSARRVLNREGLTERHARLRLGALYGAALGVGFILVAVLFAYSISGTLQASYETPALSALGLLVECLLVSLLAGLTPGGEPLAAAPASPAPDVFPSPAPPERSSTSAPESDREPDSPEMTAEESR